MSSELQGTSEGSWRTGGSPHSLLGKIFHESFADLFTATHAARWQRAITPADLATPAVLSRHVYRELAGPRIFRQQAALQEFSEDLLHFWEAVQGMCRWFCSLLQTALEAGQISYDEVSGYWINVDMLVRPEHELSWVIRDEGWLAPVRIEGRAGAVFRKPGGQEWCLVEYKTAGVSPEGDLSQAALYHGLLTASNDGEGNVSLLCFHPELRERVFNGEQLRPSLRLLKPWLGRIAGVSEQTLQLPASRLDAEAADETGRELLEVFREFDGDAELAGAPAKGPGYLQYSILPSTASVSDAKVPELVKCLRERLSLHPALLVHRRGGGKAWKIDVPRPGERSPVPFEDVRKQIDKSAGLSRMPLGVDLTGALKFIDLANPVHANVLVAGSAGSGKTEWLRMAITAMMISNTPQSFRFALLDGGSRTAFQDLTESPFLWVPEEGSGSPVAMLEMLVEEMEARYRAHRRAFVDDLKQYIDKTGDTKPRMVCICDEYVDLVTADRRTRKEVEKLVAALASKGRAAGIHLVFATRHTSRDVIAGTLQAHMTCRVAMQMPGAIASKVVLGQPGAESLLGPGDLLFQDIRELVRLQAPVVRRQGTPAGSTL